MTDLAKFLGRTAPFDALDAEALGLLAEPAHLADYPAGAEIVDAFTAIPDELGVVLSGQVQVWSTKGTYDEPPDEVLGRGNIFGYSAVLAGTPVGPRVAALGPVRMVWIPRKVAAAAFLTAPAGARLLASSDPDGGGAPVTSPLPVQRYRVVDELVVSAPVTGTPSMTVTEAAKLMTERNSSYLAVPRGAGEFGLVTDALLRDRVLAGGLPADTPLSEVMLPHGFTARTGTPTVDVLREMAQGRLDHLLVVDAAGELRGAVEPQDFLASPSAAGMVLRDRIQRAADLDQLVRLGRRLPGLLGDLVAQRRAASEVTGIYSIFVDTIQRRVLSLVLDAHPDLDEAEVTWMLLGSNARREPMLGSDIDSAVVFAESVDTAERADAYRAAFREMADVLRDAGLRIDEHGATPGNRRFSRTRAEWRTAAEEWILSPLDNQGMLMASLLLDGRPIQGDPARPVVQEVFSHVREHPGTMRLLVRESLSHRARLRSVRQVLAGRGDTFNLKTHALRPVVEIARWAAASVGSSELSTNARLAAASGSALLPAEQASTLIDVFETLQRIRMRNQLAQADRGDRVSDVVWMPRLAPLDRSLVAQSVREIASVQKRLFNLVQYTSPDEWAAPMPH